jgi:glucosylceramidase
MANNRNDHSMKRRNFLAGTSACMGGMLLTGSAPRVFGQTSPQTTPYGNNLDACPVVGPLGQILVPHKLEPTHLPTQRVPWDAVDVRMATGDDAHCQHPGAKELALKGPWCDIVEIINLDEKTTFQEMLGFGGTLTDSDCANLNRLSPEKRHAAIVALAGKDGLGFSLMRIPFGSTDSNREPNRDLNFYTYCDVPQGETDPKLTHFSLQKDIDRGIIDVIREFRAVNPNLQLLASVWGVPAWMTTNKLIYHGFFDSAFTEVYADYLVKSIQAHAALGIPIEYLTIQNEPSTGGDRATPAAMWTWEQERDVLLAVAKRFADNHITTKLWIMDHNFDMAQTFAKPLLDDPRIKKIAHMVAFHDYRGRPEEMALLGRQHPEIPAVISEHSYGTIRQLGRLMDILANGATGQISWTTVNDGRMRVPPVQPGAPSRPATPAPAPGPPDYEKMTRTMVVPQGDNPSAHLTVTYCGYQTFSPLIQRGARRIASNALTRLDTSNVAFRNPDGSVLVVAVNSGSEGFDMGVLRGNAALLFNMPPNTILSVRFKA